VTDEPHVTPPPAPSVTFNLAELLEYSARPLRIAAVVLAVLVVGVGAALIWRAYGRAPTAVTAGQGAHDVDARGKDKDIESLKAAIQQLSAAQQQIAQDVAALKSAQDGASPAKDDQPGQKTLASQQADIQRLTDRLAALDSKLEALQKSAATAAPRSHDVPRRRAEGTTGAPNAPPAARSTAPPSNPVPPSPVRH